MKLTITGHSESGGKTQVSLEVSKRAYPDAPMAEDANWLVAGISAELPGYHASFETQIRAEDFPEFLRDLKHLQETGHGTAVFSTVQEVLELSVGKSPQEQRLQWTGMTTYPAGFGAVLSFAFETDAGDLPEIITALQRLMKEFPVIG